MAGNLSDLGLLNPKNAEIDVSFFFLLKIQIKIR